MRGNFYLSLTVAPKVFKKTGVTYLHIVTYCICIAIFHVACAKIKPVFLRPDMQISVNEVVPVRIFLFIAISQVSFPFLHINNFQEIFKKIKIRCITGCTRQTGIFHWRYANKITDMQISDEQVP